MAPGGKATNPHLPLGRPFVKWAGGKAAVLPHLLRYQPVKKHPTYHEPFVGGGALFYALAARRVKDPGWRAVLSDSNERLVRTWRAVKNDVEGLMKRLRVHEKRHDKDYFYAMRAADVDSLADDLDMAAWFIYLNKTAFNGLYRVNSKNGFNVPIGSYVNPVICDEKNLRACAHLLQHVEILHESFDAVLERALPGDLVYFDPPYIPISRSASFTAYTRGGFGPDDQRRLRDVARVLKQRGVGVMLSNHDVPEVHELYADGFRIHTIQVDRAINSKGSARGKVGEVVIV